MITNYVLLLIICYVFGNCLAEAVIKKRLYYISKAFLMAIATIIVVVMNCGYQGDAPKLDVIWPNCEKLFKEHIN